MLVLGGAGGGVWAHAQSVVAHLAVEFQLEVTCGLRREGSAQQGRAGRPLSWREENRERIQGTRRPGWVKTWPLTHSGALG